MKFKILHQGLLLISIPLVCELALFGILAKLELDAENAAKKAAHARAISDGVNGLERDITDLAKFVRSLSYKEAFVADFKPYFNKMDADVSSLKELTADRPECLPVLERTAAAARRGQSLFQEARQSIIETPWSAYNIIKQARLQIGNELSMTVSPELLDLAAKFSDADEERTAENTRKLIRTLLFAALPISLCVAVGAAILFTRSISDRIWKLCQDAQLMARGERLSAVLTGSDEIAQLDQIYHQSAQMLEESNRKLQAAYDYAADLILSIDSNLRVAGANKACNEMLGISSEKISHMRIVSLIAETDRQRFIQLLEEAETDPAKVLSAEILLVHAQGNLIPTICMPRYSRVEKAIFCVFHDISQRKEAERIRSEVFAMVTHDLRAPVTSFKSFLEFAEMGKIGELSETGLKFLPMAERSVEKMTNLLNDILTLEKMKSGMLQVQNSSVSIFSVLTELRSTVFFAAEKRSVEIKIEPDNVLVMTDRDRLEQVLLNFLSNALKFSPPGTTIYLFCRKTPGELYISVKDEGPGIKPSEIGSVFVRFYEGTKKDQDLPSSGLGLAICQEIAQLLGARLEVQSELGSGSTFSIIFPRGLCS
ncbi:MAG: ATP-binding protein [Candidatus Obscuribacterales bacterium]|nr:ATP-binding protein [Candidatus Obscuribacterales bacterium]